MDTRGPKAPGGDALRDTVSAVPSGAAPPEGLGRDGVGAAGDTSTPPR